MTEHNGHSFGPSKPIETLGERVKRLMREELAEQADVIDSQKEQIAAVTFLFKTQATTIQRQSEELAGKDGRICALESRNARQREELFRLNRLTEHLHDIMRAQSAAREENIERRKRLVARVHHAELKVGQLQEILRIERERALAREKQHTEEVRQATNKVERTKGILKVERERTEWRAQRHAEEVRQAKGMYTFVIDQYRLDYRPRPPVFLDEKEPKK